VGLCGTRGDREKEKGEFRGRDRERGEGHRPHRTLSPRASASPPQPCGKLAASQPLKQSLDGRRYEGCCFHPHPPAACGSTLEGRGEEGRVGGGEALTWSPDTHRTHRHCSHVCVCAHAHRLPYHGPYSRATVRLQVLQPRTKPLWPLPCSHSTPFCAFEAFVARSTSPVRTGRPYPCNKACTALGRAGSARPHLERWRCSVRGASLSVSHGTTRGPRGKGRANREGLASGKLPCPAHPPLCSPLLPAGRKEEGRGAYPVKTLFPSPAVPSLPTPRPTVQGLQAAGGLGGRRLRGDEPRPLLTPPAPLLPSSPSLSPALLSPHV